MAVHGAGLLTHSSYTTSRDTTNDSLGKLVALTKTPSQTWAYEQFEIARDEFRRGLYPEALESVARAIDGFGSNPGYKTEFRFHFLLGDIRLGSYRNSSSEVINPSEAERAFLKAARYAESDFTEDAARAYICAGRAAYVQNHIDDATHYSLRGLQLDWANSQGHYQLSRLYCAQGDYSKAAESLYLALRLDPNLSIAAAGAPEFVQSKDRNDLVIETIKRLLKPLKEQYDKELSAFQAKLERLVSTKHFDVSASDVLNDRILELRDLIGEFLASGREGTFLGLDNAVKMISRIEHVFEASALDFKARFRARIERLLSNINILPGDQFDVRKATDRFNNWTEFLAVVIFIGLSANYLFTSRDWILDKIVSIVIGFFLMGLLLAGVIHIGERAISNEAKERREAASTAAFRRRRQLEREIAAVEEMVDPFEGPLRKRELE